MFQPETSTATVAPAGPGLDTQNQNRDPEAAVPRSEPPTPESPAAKRWRWIQYGIRPLFVVTSITALGVAGYVASQWGTQHVEKIHASVIVGVSLLSSLPGAKGWLTLWLPQQAIIAILADVLWFVMFLIRPKLAQV